MVWSWRRWGGLLCWCWRVGRCCSIGSVSCSPTSWLLCCETWPLGVGSSESKHTQPAIELKGWVRWSMMMRASGSNVTAKVVSRMVRDG